MFGDATLGSICNLAKCPLIWWSHDPVTISCPRISSRRGTYMHTEILPLRAQKHMSSLSVSAPFHGQDDGNVLAVFSSMSHQTVPRMRTLLVPHASEDVPSSFRYPTMTKKPRWWWRTLACLPYLMPLHETWLYAETAYSLHPFLEDFEFATYHFLGAIGMLPGWFMTAYFFVTYLGIVRRKEWPHFLRFHIVMGML